MLSVFFILCFLRLVRCLLLFLPFFSSKGRFFGKIFGGELLFLGVGVGFVFLGGFLPMFLLHFWRFAPESVWKIFLDVRSAVFWVRSLFLWFFVDAVFRVFFLRDKDQVVTGHPFTRTCFDRSFSFLCPAAFVCFARFGRASRFLVVFSGCHSGSRAFWGFSLDLLRPFPWDARRQGFSVLLLLCVSFSPFCFVLRLHTFSARVGDLAEVGNG